MNKAIVTIIKGTYDVRPCEQTWMGTMFLSEWDQIDCLTHIPLIYFYRRPPNALLSWLPSSAIVDTLKPSLSRVLVPFYPLAGRLQWIGNGRLQLQCNAMGVRFMEAECESSLNDIAGPSSLSYYPDSLFPSVDYSLPIHDIPLCLVQLTKFKCGGIGIALQISHAVIDGPASFHFISEWARFARGERLQTIPFNDRSVFRAGQPPLTSPPPPSLDDYPEYKNLPLLLGQLDNSEERKKKSTMAMLKITKSQVEHLRMMANDSWVGEKPMARGFTRFETICGHIWRITCKARGLKKEQPTTLAICVDSRTHMRNNELPREYFGNATFNVIAQSVVGDLTSKPLGFAASKVREAIKKVTYKYVRSSIELLKNQRDLTRFQDINEEKGPFYGNPNIEIVSWLTLPLYGYDFGWGKEEFMGLGSHGMEGNCMLVSSPQGDDSVLVDMCLQEAHMNAFKKHFYEDIIFFKTTTHALSQIGLRAAL